MTNTPPAAPSPNPDFSDEDLAAAVAFMTQDLDGEPTEVITLTDEELVAIDGVQHPQPTDLPWVDANAGDGSRRALSAAVAMRSLMARGLILTSANDKPEAYQEGGHEPLRLEALPQLRGISVARRTADAFVLVHRRTSDGAATSYFYLFALDGKRRVLWETFDSSGMHIFHLVPEELLVDQIRVFLDPEGAAGESDGTPVEVAAADFPTSDEAKRLADSRAVSTVAIARAQDESATGFSAFATPDSLVVMETEGDPEAGGTHRLAPVAAGTLEAMLRSLVEGAAPLDENA